MNEIPHTIHGFTADHLARLNSATQYPSILTYHALGERGRLTEDRTTDFSTVNPDDVEVTEKIDGTNARIIIPPRRMGGALIGSRTELLHYVHDLIPNPAQGIVEAIKDAAWRVTPLLAELDDLVVVFGEVYGGKTSSGAKNYSTTGRVGFRVFDVATVPLDVLGWERDRIASWRDSGGQEFVRSDVLAQVAEDCGLALVPLLTAGTPPVSVADTHAWLTAALVETFAGLDDSGKGRPEGVVVRTADRSLIAKIRFEDYERTAKSRRAA
jgi:hypothetical protein